MSSTTAIVCISPLRSVKIPRSFLLKILEPDLKIPKLDYGEIVAYQNSKLANTMCVCEFARRLEGTGVTVYSAHPGLVFTNIWKGPLVGLYAP